MRFAHFSSSSTKPLFAYNEKLQGVLSRHRNPSEEKKPCEKPKSHELELSDAQAQRVKLLDFRLKEAEAAGNASDETADTGSKKDDFLESPKGLSLPKDTQVISVFGS